MAASAAHIVRALQFAAIRAFLKGSDRKRVVTTTHVAPRRRSFSFWNGHLGTCLLRVEPVLQQGWKPVSDAKPKKRRVGARPDLLRMSERL
jgi:hypothetical protein